MAHPNLREADLMRLVQDWLRVHDLFFIRVNVGSMVQKGPSGTRFVKFGRQGCADILVCCNGLLIALELKTEKGRQSEYQRQFQCELEAAGGVYALCRSLDDVIAAVPTKQKRLVMA